MHQVERIKENLETIKHSNFCFKEKEDLRKIYLFQLRQNERKLKSFSFAE